MIRTLGVTWAATLLPSLVAVSLAACSSASTGEPDAELLESDEAELGAFKEGSASAYGILRTANSLSEAQLVEDAKVSASVARAIATYRRGPDGRPGTHDDQRYETLKELKARGSRVTRALPTLHAYASAHGLVEEPCKKTDDERAALQSIYYSDNWLSRRWQACYSVPQSQALAEIRAGSFADAGRFDLQSARTAGAEILVKPLQPAEGLEDGYVHFMRCPFTKAADECHYQDCRIELLADADRWTPDGDSQATFVVRQSACDQENPAGAPARFVDCQSRVVRQPYATQTSAMARSELKTFAFLNSRQFQPPPGMPQDRDYASASAIGGWSPTRSDACVPWTPRLGWTWMSAIQFPEVCDGSYRDFPNGDLWCPWKVTFYRISCVGFGEVENVRASPTEPFDGSPELAAYCKGR